MDNPMPRRVHISLVAMVSLQAVLAALIGIFSLTCSGWGVESNNKALLGLRLLGYLGTSGAALYAIDKRRYVLSSCLLVSTSLFYIWLETGWLFRQPAFGPPSKVAMIPLLIALVALLAPHSPTLNPPGPQKPGT
jgi:hypothetical protein